MRTLIVDDKKENLYLLETLLKGCGYEVVSASNGAEALEKLHTHDFDVIISDILMPVMDGFQLLHEVKKDEKWKGIPFVFYTATYTDKKDEDFALQLGADMFIRKPMDPDEFIKIIDRMLGEVKKGKIEHKEPTVKGEEDAYKLYSERLVKKLEQKMLNLEKEIAERKEAEGALRESESKYRTLVEHIPQKIFIKDRNSVYVSSNENYARDLGLTPEEIAGKTDYDFFPKELADKYRADDRRIMDSGKEESIEEEYIQDGQKIWVHTIKTPVREKMGDIVGILGIFFDITERKRMEVERERYLKELEQRNAEMERFAYTISHELRTPLVTVESYTDLLQRDLERLEREKVVSDLRFIQNAVTSMARLLEDTLELSRTGRVMNLPEDVPFSALVRDALVQLTEQLKWIGIDVAVAEDLPTVHVDRMRLVEVLVNLVENSIKFMGDQTRPRIEIGSRKEGEETVFYVKDNGIGLDKSQHEKVFELFYKVEKKSKGSGAGLAIVKRIIEVHGGRIWIESELGKGCTVCFTLPV
jgi:PAS domain S-box-containing protein